MIVTIQINTSEALSAEDKGILRAVGYMDTDSAPEAPASAPKTTAAKKAAPAKKAAAAAPSPEPETASPAGESTEDTVPDTALRDAALARASELLSSGSRARVMEALAAAGAERVSGVPEENLQSFLDAITD